MVISAAVYPSEADVGENQGTGRLGIYKKPVCSFFVGSLTRGLEFRAIIAISRCDTAWFAFRGALCL